MINVIKSVIFGTLLSLSFMSSAFAIDPSTIPAVVSITKMQTLPLNQYQTIIVTDEQGGGDTFKWKSGPTLTDCPNSAIDSGICFTENGLSSSSGHWARQRPDQYVTFTDYGAQKAGTTNLAAAQLALTNCSYGWPIRFVPGRWVMGGSVGLNAPSQCTDFEGASVNLNIASFAATYFRSATLDFSTNTLATPGAAYISRLGASLTNYDPGSSFGDFNIIGNLTNGTPGVIGFYDASIKDDLIHDIFANQINGPAFKFGFSYGIHADHLRAVNSGASGYCMFEVDGGSGQITNSTTTTFYASHIDLEGSSGANTPDCGFKIDRLTTGDIEESIIEPGVPWLWIATKNQTTFNVAGLHIHDNDFEGACGTTAATVGSGTWGGVASRFVTGLLFENNNFVCTTATTMWNITQSLGFTASNNLITSGGTTPTIYNFSGADGTSLGAYIMANPRAAFSIAACCTYVTINSVVTDASPYADWHMTGIEDRYSAIFSAGLSGNQFFKCGVRAPVIVVTSTLAADANLIPSATDYCQSGSFKQFRNEATLAGHTLNCTETSGSHALALHSTCTLFLQGSTWYESQSAP